MPTMMIEYRTDAERAAIERAVAFAAEMHDLAAAAPAGSVLDACEGHVLDRGRDLLRDTLQQAVQARVDEAELKPARPACVRAAAGCTRSGGAGGD